MIKVEDIFTSLQGLSFIYLTGKMFDVSKISSSLNRSKEVIYFFGGNVVRSEGEEHEQVLNTCILILSSQVRLILRRSNSVASTEVASNQQN